MEIRLLKPDEAEKHFRCSAISFIWPLDMDKETLSDDPRLGVFGDDGTLMAELTFVPHQASFCGGVITALMIDEVITLPAYRRKGYIRRLFHELEQMAPRENWAFGALCPFSWSYYRKFGYDRIRQLMHLDVPMHSLEKFPRNCNVKLHEGAYSAELLALYNASATRQHLQFHRTDAKCYPAKPFATCEYTYLWYGTDGKPHSYIIYTVDRSTRTVRVRELVYEDAASLAGILGFLRGHDGQTDSVSFESLPLGSPLYLLIDDYEHTKVKTQSVLSGRIYNLQTVLEQNIYPQSHGGFRLLSHDTIPQNNGLFEVEYQNGKAQITKVQSGAPDIELGSTAAARLLLSGEGFTAKTVQFLDGATLHTGAEDFFRAFPARGIE